MWSNPCLLWSLSLSSWLCFSLSSLTLQSRAMPASHRCAPHEQMKFWLEVQFTVYNTVAYSFASVVCLKGTLFSLYSLRYIGKQTIVLKIKKKEAKRRWLCNSKTKMRMLERGHISRSSHCYKRPLLQGGNKLKTPFFFFCLLLQFRLQIARQIFLGTAKSILSSVLASSLII